MSVKIETENVKETEASAELIWRMELPMKLRGWLYE